MSTLYNDNDPKVCAWLRELIASDHLPLGPVFERSIEDLTNDDLLPYDTFHAFAGIGGWALALQLAGWPDGEPVWTASCPCQPFSCAGQRRGESDERHLWPEFKRLVALRRPPTIFGEQVASKAGREWLAGVRADLEALGYAVGAADLCAASVGAPHIRQRLYWVAHSQSQHDGSRDARERRGIEFADGGDACRVALAASPKRGPLSEHQQCFSDGSGQCWGQAQRASGACRPLRYWDSSAFLPCLDNQQRRIEPGTFPLAHGVSGRVGLLRGYGNAIVPQVAAAFISAFRDARRELAF